MFEYRYVGIDLWFEEEKVAERLIAGWFSLHEEAVNARQKVLESAVYVCSVCTLRVMHAYDSWEQGPRQYAHRACLNMQPSSKVDGYFLAEGVQPSQAAPVDRSEQAPRKLRNYLGVDRDEYAEFKAWKEVQ